MTVLHLQRYLVIAYDEVFVGDDEASLIGFLPFEVLVDGVVGIRRTAGYVVAAHLVPVDVEHDAVVHLIVEREDVSIGKWSVDAEGVAEVVGGALGVCSGVQLRDGVLLHEVSFFGKAEGSCSSLPVAFRFVEGNGLPVEAVHRATVEVHPFGAERNECLGDGLFADHVPAAEGVASWRLCRELYGLSFVGIEVAGEEAGGYLLSVDGEPCLGDVCREGGVDVEGGIEVAAQVADACAVVGRANGVGQAHAGAAVFEGQGWIDVIVYLAHDVFASCGLEHAAVHDAEGVHELPSEGVVGHEVAEEVVHVGTARGVQHSCEHVGGAEG